jgi:hypothetical protein
VLDHSVVIPDLFLKIASLKFLPHLFFSFVERTSNALNLLGGPVEQPRAPLNLNEGVMSSSNHPHMAYSPVGGSEGVAPSEHSTPTQVN